IRTVYSSNSPLFLSSTKLRGFPSLYTSFITDKISSVTIAYWTVKVFLTAITSITNRPDAVRSSLVISISDSLKLRLMVGSSTPPSFNNGALMLWRPPYVLAHQYGHSQACVQV